MLFKPFNQITTKTGKEYTIKTVRSKIIVTTCNLIVFKKDIVFIQTNIFDE